jgi:hypothetical protein
MLQCRVKMHFGRWQIFCFADLSDGGVRNWLRHVVRAAAVNPRYPHASVKAEDNIISTNRGVARLFPSVLTLNFTATAQWTKLSIQLKPNKGD